MFQEIVFDIDGLNSESNKDVRWLKEGNFVVGQIYYDEKWDNVCVWEIIPSLKGVYETGYNAVNDILYFFNTPCQSVEYGVADNIEQLLSLDWIDKYRQSEKEYIVTFCTVEKKDQPSKYGWRWYKWGQYYGNHQIQCEYLHDEVGIDSVIVFNIIELL
jgi:hypothetical protein